MTIMLILNLVLAVAVVTGILSLLAWGIVTDKARMASITRHAARTRAHAATAETHPRYQGRYGWGSELSA